MHPDKSANGASATVTGVVTMVLLFQLIPSAPKPAATEQKQPTAARQMEAENAKSGDAMEGVAIQLPPPPVLERNVADTQSEASEVEQESPKPREPAPSLQPRIDVAQPVKKNIEPLKPPPPTPKTKLTPEPNKTAATPDHAVTVSEPKVAPHEPKTIELNPVASLETTRQGGVLLRLLEHGEGPSIEIAWPESLPLRRRLYKLLSHCFGMRTALMDRQGDLYIAEGPAGERWPLNLDRYSGFVRTPAGFLANEEQIEAARIHRHHSELSQLNPVRIFPRRADALLLGGLSHLLGPQYKTSKQIRAHYSFRGAQLVIDRIHVDNQAMFGEILFTPNSRCS